MPPRAAPRLAGRWTWALLFGALCAVSLAAACGDPSPPAGSTPNGSQTLNGDAPQAASEADQGFTLEVPFEVIGDHLEATEIEVGLQFWLEASKDPAIAALPGRAKASVGALYQPSLTSPTDETFWIHVFTDQSRGAAIEWVRHLASQPPSTGRLIVPQHDLFEAAFQEAPNVGDASVSIELLHGHSAGCWRSELLVFAQNGVVVFLKSVIEVTSDEPDDGAAAICGDSGATAPLTDIDRIAFAISEQLAAAQ